MLNEIEELKEYIGKTEDCSRLNPWFFLKKNRGGIPRALTIISRHYLFDEYHYNTLTNPSEKKSAREKTKHLLAAWCGFDYRKFLNNTEKNIDNNTDIELLQQMGFDGNNTGEDIDNETAIEQLQQMGFDKYNAEENIANNIAKDIDVQLIKKDKIENWLPRYIKEHPYKKDLDKTYVTNELDSFIQEYEKKWYVKSQKDIYQLVNHQFNIDAINFYSIIADAIQAGPLMKRELFYDEESFDNDFNMKSKVKERVIKIIGAYLISLNGQTPNNQTIHLNNIDLSNWMNYPSLGQGKNKDQLFNESTSFITSYTNGLYTIDMDFLEEYNFRIET